MKNCLLRLSLSPTWIPLFDFWFYTYCLNELKTSCCIYLLCNLYWDLLLSADVSRAIFTLSYVGKRACSTFCIFVCFFSISLRRLEKTHNHLSMIFFSLCGNYVLPATCPVSKTCFLVVLQEDSPLYLKKHPYRKVTFRGTLIARGWERLREIRPNMVVFLFIEKSRFQPACQLCLGSSKVAYKKPR